MISKKADHDRVGMNSMNAKRDIKTELTEIHKKINRMKQTNAREKEVLAERERAQKTNADLSTVIRFLMDENRKTTVILQNLQEAVSRIEHSIPDPYYDEDIETEEQRQATAFRSAKERILLSGLDAEIIKAVQLLGDRACADEIKKHMNYKGRNAASVRLNRLAALGLLERRRVGRRVYYIYDAGKATDILIVSPPQ